MIFHFVRIYYHLCIFFLIFNLKHLLEDSYSVKYLEQDLSQYRPSINFWICTEFKEIKEKLNFEFSFSNKANYIKIGELLNATINRLETQLKPKFRFQLKETHLFNRHFCFTVKEADFKVSLNDYVSNFDIKLYAFSNGFLPLFCKSIYSKKSYFKMPNFRIHQQIFLENESPYLSCVQQRNNETNTNFNCLKACFDEANRKDVYFDFYDQNKEINLEFIFKKVVSFNDESDYRNCFTRCYRKDVCFWETYNTVDFAIDFRIDNSDSRFKIDQLVIETRPLLSEFWIQFIGLVTLFTGTSFVGSTSDLLICIFKKLNRQHLIKKYFFSFKFTLILFSLIFLIRKSLSSINDYHHNLDYPNKTWLLNFSLEPTSFSLIVCAPIQYLISSKQNLTKDEDEAILRENNFGELESKTSEGLEKIIDKIYLKYGGNLKSELNYKPSKKVIFKSSSTFVNNKKRISIFERCFRINIEVQIDRHRSMNTIGSLLIVFKNELYELFLTDTRLDFSSDKHFQVREFKIKKLFYRKSDRSLKANCTNYLVKSYCNSRSNCISKCINRHFMHRYSSITTGTIVDKDDFIESIEFDTLIKQFNLTNTFQNSSSSILADLKNSYFNNTFDKSINETCETIFKNEDCELILFDDTFKKGMTINKKQIEIELYHEKAIEVDIQLNLITSILLILNLESILFGSNFASLFILFFSILKSILKLRFYAIYNFIIFLACLIGFTVHVYLIIQNEILTSKLIDAGSFERVDELALPNLIFCLPYEFGERLNVNYQKTGRYLHNKHTPDLTFEKIFNKIIYFNQTEFVDLFAIDKKHIKLSYFFFNNLKCHEIENSIVYKESDFYFKDSIYSLKLFFNENFKNESFFFFYRAKQSKQLIEIYRFDLKDVKYKIKLELFEIQIEDKFELFKNLPKLLFKEQSYLNDASKYLANMKDEFINRFNLTTLKIPLEEKEFEIELNEQLFYQYYLQIQKPIDEKHPSNKNSKRILYNLYEQRFTDQRNLSDKKNYRIDNEPDISFGINFSIRIVKVTNDSNFTKVIQNVLNVLSLWLDVCILDFYKWFKHLICPLKHLYKFLHFLKHFIKPNFELIN